MNGLKGVIVIATIVAAAAVLSACERSYEAASAKPAWSIAFQRSVR